MWNTNWRVKNAPAVLSDQHTEVGSEMLDVLQRFQKIEEKSKCLRVQFLDWLSDKLLDWSNRVHVVAANIDSPCIIKVEPRKKEESKSAKENKELARIKELLAKEQERADQWRTQAINLAAIAESKIETKEESK